MSLSLDDVQRIAHLARIAITPDEAQRTLVQLTDIFALIAQMQAVDTTGVEPMAHPLGGEQRLRADTAAANTQAFDARALYLCNAPEQDAGLFLVPRVLE